MLMKLSPGTTARYLETHPGLKQLLTDAFFKATE
jgi:hypothetical protein